MSARRKGKPQQRIHLDAVEAENDLLTCGRCQQEFYLCDINSFIKHKIRLCSKNALNCHLDDASPPPHNHDDQDDPDEPLSNNTAIKPPEEDQADGKTSKAFNFQALFSSKGSLERIIREELARSEGRGKGGGATKVDAETITVYSEPSLFTCSTCKSVYSSSWFLIQHVQKSHGLSIYVDPSSSSSEGGGERVGGRVADLVLEDPGLTPPSSTGESAAPPKSPVITSSSSSKTELFTPPFLSSAAGQPHNLAALSSSPWPASYRPVQNSELLHSDFISRLAGSLPFRPPTAATTTPPGGAGGADITLQDIYSQRLRQLAGQPNASIITTSPQALSSPVSKKPPSLGTETPSAFSTPSKTGLNTAAVSITTEGDKGYTCSVCSKQFRFNVTLTAHQRNHTGEKPFKCPLCALSFSLASRLKHHLVYKHKFAALANLESSTQSTDPQDGNEEGSDEEGEPPDTQEFVLQETQAEAELIMANRHKLAKSMVNSMSMDPSKRDNASSVLSEVIKGSGMDKIPQFKEAFEAALDEMSDNEERSDESNSENQELMDSASEMTEASVKEESWDGTAQNKWPSSQSRDSSPTPAKLIKLEAQGEDVKPTTGIYNNSLYSNEIRNAATMAAVAQVGMYPSLWFQPSNPRDFLPFPARGSIFSTTRENGLATTTQSASKVSQSSKVTSGGTSTPSKSPTNGQATIRRRNDTCEYCGKIFKNCSNLTVHRRSHTGEKPYKCQLCSYACAQSSKLTRHMRTHGRTGKDVYKCKFCDMPFSVPSTLEKHMRKCMENHPNMSSSPVSLSKTMEGQTSQAGSTPVSLLGNLSLNKALDIGLPSTGLGFSNSGTDSAPYNGLDFSGLGKTQDAESMVKVESKPYNGLDLSKAIVASLPTIPLEKDEKGDTGVSLLGNLSLNKTLETEVLSPTLIGPGFSNSGTDSSPYNGLSISGLGKTQDAESTGKTWSEPYNGLDLSKTLGAIVPKMPLENETKGEPGNLSLTNVMDNAGISKSVVEIVPHNGLDLSKSPDIGVTSVSEKTREVESIKAIDGKGYNGLDLSKSKADDEDEEEMDIEVTSNIVPYNGLDLSKPLDIRMTTGSGKTQESMEKLDNDKVYNGLDLSKGFGLSTLAQKNAEEGEQGDDWDTEEAEEEEQSNDSTNLGKMPGISCSTWQGENVYNGLNQSRDAGGSASSGSGESTGGEEEEEDAQEAEHTTTANLTLG